MSEARAQIEIVASTARLPAALQAATNMVRGFAGNVATAMAAATRPLLDIGKRAVGHALGNLATRGIDFLVEQGKGVLDFEEKLVRLGLASRKSGAELRAIGDEARSLSTSTGLDAVEVLRGARAYIDLAGAESYTAEKMSLIARAAQASGSDIGDMATVVYSLQNALGIKNNELEDTIGGILNQSKDGSVHFAQMAQELISLAPVYKQFGITGREGAIQLGAQLQIVRSGFGSASEAGTGLLRIYRSLPQHAKLFEKNGVQIFKEGSRKDLLSFDQILKNIKKSRLDMNRPDLIKAFGRGEAERSYQLLQDLVSKYDELVKAGHANGVVQADLSTYTESSSGRIAMAMEKMKNAVAVAFTPERVAGFADALTRAASNFMDAAHWIDSHVSPSPQSSRKTAVGEIVGDVENQERSLDEQKRLAYDMQNYNPGDDLPHSVMVSIRKRKSILQHGAEGSDDFRDDTVAAVREAGDQIGQHLQEMGAEKTQSFGAMVRHDEEGAAGRRFLGRLGVPQQLGGGTPQEFAAAVREVLAPSLERIARALDGEKVTEVKVNSSTIAKAVDNDPGRRR